VARSIATGLFVVAVLSVAAGCGGARVSASAANATAGCSASIGIAAPLTGQIAQLGQEQLHFAQLAVAIDNRKNRTNIKLVQGDTQLSPAQAVTVAQQFISNSKVVALVGPGGSQEVDAVGALFARSGMAFISGSATNARLTNGRYPTFFRVVSKDSVQGPQDARYVVARLHPRRVMIVDDQETYSTGLVGAMADVFSRAGVAVDHESVNQQTTDFSSLVAKVTESTTVVILPWQVPAHAQQLGRDLAEQRKRAVIFGTDGVFAPGTFTIPGSYVSSLGPDIRAIPAAAPIAAAATARWGAFGTAGPPTYAATHVVDDAIATVCRSGHTPTRRNVLAAIRSTNEPTSILGQPIKFDAHGDRVGATWFVFRIDPHGKYRLISTG
jgi:branched-chain amino acid transport system substrate-binding protein